MASDAANQRGDTNTIPENPWKNFYAYYRFKLGRDSPSDARNTLLVVATLIAAVTFQASVNPPGGVWQDTSGNHTAGKSVWGTTNSDGYKVFIFSNTLAYSAAVQVILSLVIDCPFYTEIWIAIGSMSFTYGASLASVRPSGVWSAGFLFIPLLIPYILRIALQFMRWFK